MIAPLSSCTAGLFTPSEAKGMPAFPSHQKTNPSFRAPVSQAFRPEESLFPGPPVSRPASSLFLVGAKHRCAPSQQGHNRASFRAQREIPLPLCVLLLNNICHPERREGSAFLPVLSTAGLQAGILQRRHSSDSRRGFCRGRLLRRAAITLTLCPGLSHSSTLSLLHSSPLQS
jgi:hypothetical protein